MVEIEEVAPDIYKIEAALPRSPFTLFIALMPVGGGVLIEPGPAIMLPVIEEGMRKLGTKGVEYIITSHVHLDHAGGLGKLALLFPQARFVLHPEGVRHMVDPARLIEGTRSAFGKDFEQVWGDILPLPHSRVLAPPDGEVLMVGGRSLRIIHSPGHAPHHIVVFDLESRGLFCGEALGVPYPMEGCFFISPAAAQPSFDMELYLATAERLRALKPSLLFFAHNGVGREPDKLIDMNNATTRLFAEIIAGGMERGESVVEISRKLHGEILKRAGCDMSRINLENGINAYLLYFRKRKPPARPIS